MERLGIRWMLAGALLVGGWAFEPTWAANPWGGTWQDADPYRAPLLPIHGRSEPTSSADAKRPGDAPVRLIVGPLGRTPQALPTTEGRQGEPLPSPLSSPAADKAATEQDSASDGIVRLLKPLTVEPQSREVLTQRYPTGQVMIEREVSLDQHGNYLNDGSWKMYDLDQQLIGIGRFDRGQMVGLWRRVHLEPNHPWFNTSEFRGFTSPLISSAEFIDGKLHGAWLIKDRQDRKVVELHYREGQRQGTGRWWHPNGQLRRQLQFEQDLLHGPWQEWNSEGQLQTENWFVEGQRIDKEVNYFEANRPESEQSFLEAQLTLDGEDDWWNARLATYQRTGTRVQTGPVKAWYDNGQRHMAGYYKDGLRHGEFAWWHANGNRKLICTYEEGQRVGKWVWWHENGIKAAEGSFAEDVPVGQWLAWNDQGEITNTRDWPRERQSLARPDYGDASDLELEELPPQQGLDAPLVPSLDQVELPPPLSKPDTSGSPPQAGPATGAPPSGEAQANPSGNPRPGEKSSESGAGASPPRPPASELELELDPPAEGQSLDPPPRPAREQPITDSH